MSGHCSSAKKIKIFWGKFYEKKFDFRDLRAFAITAFVSSEILITTTEKCMFTRSSD